MSEMKKIGHGKCRTESKPKVMTWGCRGGALDREIQQLDGGLGAKPLG